MSKYMLAGSLGLNVVLAVLLMLGSNWEDRPDVLPAGSADLSDLYRWGRDSGLPDESVGKLVLDQIRTQQPPGQKDGHAWRSQSMRQTEQAIERMKFDQRAREVLIAEFGAQASTDRAFTAVFQPYAQSYPFLPPAKQVTLQQLVLQDQQQTLATMATSRLSSGQPGAEAMGSIKALLSEEEYFEYQLRESELAERLARGAFQFTEQEFRGVFRAYLSSGAAEVAQSGRVPLPRSQESADSVQAELEKILGAERYVEFKRSRDPVYALLRESAMKRGANDGIVDSAYALIEGTERKAVQIRQDQQRSMDTKRRMLSELYGNRNQDLHKVLGDALYSELQSVLAPARSPLAVDRLPFNRQVATTR